MVSGLCVVPTCRLSSSVCVFNLACHILHILCSVSHVLAMAAVFRSGLPHNVMHSNSGHVTVRTSARHKDLVEIYLCPTAVTLQCHLIL